MTLIADVVTAITGSPAPVLFLDSCILLDIVRAPLRNKPSEIQFARLFLTAVQKASDNSICSRLPDPRRSGRTTLPRRRMIAQ